jgi:hypothetical protein
MEFQLFHILAGILLLFVGRRLFWLFVGLLGFVAGITFATQYFSNQPSWMLLAIALICGLVGILLAVFLQKLAIAIGGFLAGGLFLQSFVQALGWNIAPLIPFIAGGILGAILLLAVFDWALIFLSSITGAILISRALPLQSPLDLITFVVLLVIGIFVQARYLTPPAVVERKAA